MWTKEDIPDLTGKTAIVTGGNTGVGYETAKALYEAGATVIIAARDPHKAQAAIESIQAAGQGRGMLAAGLLDLANLSRIQAFAAAFQSDYSSLDILVNNAGVMIPPASTTDDGFEMQFGVNFLGHFALTGHLLPLLKKAGNARVVTVSSGAAIRVDGIDFDNLRLEKPYDAWREYAVSKLADILFTRELDRRATQAHAGVISAAAHPGVTRTDLQRHIPTEELEGLWARFNTIMEPWQGALPQLYAATAAGVQGGAFYGPDGDEEFSGYPALSDYNTPAMQDEALAARLWDYATTATGIHYSF